MWKIKTRFVFKHVSFGGKRNMLIKKGRFVRIVIRLAQNMPLDFWSGDRDFDGKLTPLTVTCKRAVLSFQFCLFFTNWTKLIWIWKVLTFRIHWKQYVDATTEQMYSVQLRKLWRFYWFRLKYLMNLHLPSAGPAVKVISDFGGLSFDLLRGYDTHLKDLPYTFRW